MSSAIGEPEPKGRLAGALGEAVFECLLETEELFFYALIPILCIGALYAVGVMVYQSTFDSRAVEVASNVNPLSIDPNKWLPRS